MSGRARLNRLGGALGLCAYLGACTRPPEPPPAPLPPRVLRSLSSTPPAAPAPAELREEGLDQIRRRLLDEQDTDCDQRITRDDQGNRRFRFRWQDQPYQLSGGYVLSNLLEELTLDLQSGQSPQLARVMEDPIGRFSRVFATTGWDALSRSVDEAGLPAILEDPKLSQRPERTLYVPADDRRALGYFLGVAERYNSAYRRLARATVNLPLLGTLSDASTAERSQELVVLLRSPEGRKSFNDLRERLALSAHELSHRALSEHLARTLGRVSDLAGRAELPCVQSSNLRLTQLARRLARELAVFRPHSLRVRPLLSGSGDDQTPAVAAPGALSLALRGADSGLEGVPFVLPGGGAEQMNGWDSYFILLGLLGDGRLELARGLVDNFVYAVEHYQTTLSANRSYYLARSEPPFLAGMIRAMWEATPVPDRDRVWLRRALDAAVTEYKRVWTRAPRQISSLCQGDGDGRVCLSRYAGSGSGQPPEVEPGSFDWLWQELGRSLEVSYVAHQLGGRDLNAELDRAFRNDRCMRESGHEATYRWFWPVGPAPTGPPPVNRCTEMVSVDLNSLLYKYEVDVARLEAELERAPEPWCARAGRRFALLKKHLWSAQEGSFYDAFLGPQGPVSTGYVNATALYPLWATAEACLPNGNTASEPGRLSAEEKSALVTNALGQLEAPGGLLASARSSRERFSARADRGWDYPNGWAPHQILAWRALEAHGFHEDAQRLAFSWLYLLLTQVIDYDGSTLDKYDVVERGHALDFDPQSERGDLGASGFAWTNASFQIGLRLLDPAQRVRLAQALAGR
ncbi:MAG: trehalase family glycosidase [Deltaproteobacteria bacterium]